MAFSRYKTLLSLENLGFGPFFSAQYELLPNSSGLTPARIIADNRGIYRLMGCHAFLGELSGRLRNELHPEQLPTTGDWVAVADDSERAIVHHVFDRKTGLFRKAVGSSGRGQLLAANVDTFLIVSSANQDFNIRRLERYLTAVWDSGARPVLVLSKIDLAENLDIYRQGLEAIAWGVPVVELSAYSGAGLEELLQHLPAGETAALIGSSGVGKSSLLNALASQTIQDAREIRNDGKGRHTTTGRMLSLLPGGQIVIDSPGIRELGLWAGEEALETTFNDISAFAEDCRFRDCLHQGEPGCAVLSAVQRGELGEDRYQSYLKLQAELAALERRRDPTQANNSKRRSKHIAKQVRALNKAGGKRCEH